MRIQFEETVGKKPFVQKMRSVREDRKRSNVVLRQRRAERRLVLGSKVAG